MAAAVLAVVGTGRAHHSGRDRLRIGPHGLSINSWSHSPHRAEVVAALHRHAHPTTARSTEPVSPPHNISWDRHRNSTIPVRPPVIARAVDERIKRFGIITLTEEW